MFLVYKSTFQSLAPTVGLLGVRCDVNVRPSGADFVHRRVGFKRFGSKSEVSSASFVHRHVGFNGLFEFWSHFCAQARGF